MTLTIPVDVWSDIACPWCYVGKARLDAAVSRVEARHKAESPPVHIQVTWHAYMIDPRTQAQGEEYLAYNRRRWGGDGWTHSLRRAGAKSGLGFADWKWWPNTLNAHRLVHRAKAAGKGGEAKELLLQLTYEQGKNVSDLAVLAEAGRLLGIPDVDAYLVSEVGRAEVWEEDRVGKKELSISGVPYFIIDNTSALSGAQEASAFEEVLEEAISKRRGGA